ncbi:hypothetical protein [Bacillus subtilis]|uniref:hypothetical protein n=1 Tax=Bacillus subtilis TaxID=1423 RepID=UPI001642361E|nr:hypothetical protein [Bacillus subtilis]
MIFMKRVMEGEREMGKKVEGEYYGEVEEIEGGDFVVVEVSVYLNTDPDDEDGVKELNEYWGY